MFIYFWQRERQSVSGGGAEREGDTDSEAGARLPAVSTEPDAGFEPTDREIMTWAEAGPLPDGAVQAPPFCLTLNGASQLYHAPFFQQTRNKQPKKNFWGVSLLNGIKIG